MALVGAGDVVGNGTGEITDLGAVLEWLLKLPPSVTKIGYGAFSKDSAQPLSIILAIWVLRHLCALGFTPPRRR